MSAPMNMGSTSAALDVHGALTWKSCYLTDGSLDVKAALTFSSTYKSIVYTSLPYCSLGDRSNPRMYASVEP